jgi:hypothetical protein
MVSKTIEKVSYGPREKKKCIFDMLVIPVILYNCKLCSSSISKEFWRKIEQI